MTNQQLVINGGLANPGRDATAQAFAARQQAALAEAPTVLETIPTTAVSLAAGDLTGIAAMRRLVTGDAPPGIDTALADPPPTFAPLDALIDELDRNHAQLVR